jgi:hypothetical protein
MMEPYKHSVRVKTDTVEFWMWGVSTLKTGTWNKMIALFGDSATYYFENEEDKLAFKIRFGL